MRPTVRKFGVGVATVGLLSGGIFAVGTAQAPESEAAVCGYSTQMEDYSSGWNWELPLVGEVDLFGGQRQVAFYGNCTSGNDQISVSTANGSQTYCVAPGETRLGYTEIDSQVSNAVKLGTC